MQVLRLHVLWHAFGQLRPWRARLTWQLLVHKMQPRGEQSGRQVLKGGALPRLAARHVDQQHDVQRACVERVVLVGHFLRAPHDMRALEHLVVAASLLELQLILAQSKLARPLGREGEREGAVLWLRVIRAVEEQPCDVGCRTPVSSP
eukprot:6199233-Pleurochrysis_carterae.AAC.1